MKNETELNHKIASIGKVMLADSIFKYIEIKGFEGGEVFKRVDVCKESNRNIDRIEIGMNINLNHEKFYTFSFDSEIKLDVI